MKDELLFDFCKSLSIIYAMPVRLYKGDEQVACFEGFSLSKKLEDHFIGSTYRTLQKSGKTTDVHISQNLFEYGICRNLEGELTVFVGPCRTLPVNETMANTLAERSGADKEELNTVAKYISTLRLMQIKRFLHILIVIHEALNGTKLDISEFCVDDMERETNEKAASDLTEHLRRVTYEFESKIDYFDSEQRILFYITNGMTDQLKKFWQEAKVDQYTADDKETLRIVKNFCIASVAVVTRGVLASDLNPEDIYFLRDEYIMQVEMCKSVPETLKLRYNMLIDFSERIQKLKCGNSDHPLVGRVASYVQKNVEKRGELYY